MSELYHHSFAAMGTECNLHLYADDQTAADQMIEAAVTEVYRIAAKYSRYRADSFLARINRAAEAGGEIEVDDETAGLLDFAWACYLKSDGLFDVTSEILREGWDFGSPKSPNSGRRVQISGHGLITRQRIETIPRPLNSTTPISNPA